MPPRDTAAGAAIYNRYTLKIYDAWVHGFSNRYLWECTTGNLHALYGRHVSANHLEVGAGTGFMLRHAQFPVLKPRLVLLDLNPQTLQTASTAVAHLQPAGVVADLLGESFPDLPPFDSIAFNYVWHCLPGPSAYKASAFARLASLLRPGGVLFGATLLGDGIGLNPAARAVMALYNRRGIFGNRDDSLATLEAALAPHFSRVEIRMDGVAALFTAWK